MSTTTTNATNVALVDTVTGVAFGPTFDSEEHADDFLAWLALEPRVEPIRLLGQRSLAFADPRCYGPGTLEGLVAKWRGERCDDDGDLRDLIGVCVECGHRQRLPEWPSRSAFVDSCERTFQKTEDGVTTAEYECEGKLEVELGDPS